MGRYYDVVSKSVVVVVVDFDVPGGSFLQDVCAYHQFSLRVELRCQPL
jgi:hypothetical protein